MISFGGLLTHGRLASSWPGPISDVTGSDLWPVWATTSPLSPVSSFITYSGGHPVPPIYTHLICQFRLCALLLLDVCDVLSWIYLLQKQFGSNSFPKLSWAKNQRRGLTWPAFALSPSLSPLTNEI